MKTTDMASIYTAWESAVSDSREPNSIISQLNSLYWNIGVYRAQNLTWGYGKSDTASIPPLFFDFYLKTFSLYLIATLRKLLEKGPLCNTKRSIISLSSIVSHIKENRQHYTRSELFRIHNVPYSYEKVKAAHEKYSQEQLRAGKRSSWLPSELNEWIPKSFHERWDSLAGTTPASRKETDMLREDHLIYLENQIATHREKIEFVANKYYLHASTIESRSFSEHSDETAWPSINNLIEIALECGTLYAQVSELLVHGPTPPLAYAEFDKWEGFRSNRYATKEDLEADWTAWTHQIHEAIRVPLPSEYEKVSTGS